MDKLKSNIGVIMVILGLIGSTGTFYSKFAKMELTIQQLSNKTAPDLSGIETNGFGITDNTTAIAVLEEKVAALESKKPHKPVDITGVETRSKINEKSIKLLELQIEELKASSNPLGG